MINSYFALGYKCNHNCLTCPLSTFDRLHGNLSSEIILKHITDLAKYKDDLHITISGGEPTLNSEFLNVLKILGSVNAYISVLSNGTTCEDKDFVKKIIESLGSDYDFSRFQFITAIHSSNKNIHDKFTGVEGSLERSLKGLKNLDEYHFNVFIKHILNKTSTTNLKDLISFITNYYSNNVGIELCSMDYSGRTLKNLDELYISNDELTTTIEESLDLYERDKDNCGRTLEILETPLCLTDPYYWKYYHLREKTNMEYIAPNNENEDNRDNTTSFGPHTSYKECEDCCVKTYCDGVWESTYNLEEDKSKVLRKIKTM